MISKRTEEVEAPARAAESRGAERNSGTAPLGAEVSTATSGRTKSESHEPRECKLMERVVERSNLRLAYQRVVENKGAGGIDEMPVSELKDWLAVHWPSVKKALLEDSYLPRPVRRVDIRSRMAGYGRSECRRWWTG
jgi:RNA-directed DNA polymerase